MVMRRLRGILGTAVLWGVPWAFSLGLIAASAALILGAHLGPFLAFARGALTGFYWGIAAGALFGSALMLTEQRRGFTKLSLKRAAAWGALSGIWFPALIGLAFGPSAQPLLVIGWPAYLATGSMGALSGLATLWLARRGAPSVASDPSVEATELPAGAQADSLPSPSAPTGLGNTAKDSARRR